MSDTIAPTIDAAGLHLPTYNDVLAYFTAQYQGIYGSDVYLGNDSQDGQFLGILSLAYSDVCSGIAGAYTNFSPATAQGVGLSAAVQINGIMRDVASYSTVAVTIVGVQNTTITNGSVKDTVYNQIWNLPASVTIPSSGTIPVTATCAILGDNTAAPGTVTYINTPTAGWQSVTNTAAAAPGAPVEDDAQLRQRQAVSVALPALTEIEALQGALLSLPNVLNVLIHENATSTTDGQGVPAHSIACVVEGGDVGQIAQTIVLYKTPGTGTFGTTSEVVTNSYGIPITINFDVVTQVPITIVVNGTALAGYTTAIGQEIVNALVAYGQQLEIGESVYFTRLYTPANLAPPDGNTFDLTSILISTGGTPAATNVAIAYYQLATISAANITVNIS